VHAVDLAAVFTAVLVFVGFAGVLARQRFMMRLPGAIALALQLPSRGTRWLYGIGRYVDGEFRWYRALGVGTRPSRVLRRGHVQVLTRRSPVASEKHSLPSSVIIIECRSDEGPFAMALSEGAYTGFVSWLESSAPMP